MACSFLIPPDPRLMPVTSLGAITSLMMNPGLPWEYWLDYWLECPIEGINSEDELRSVWLKQRKPVLQ